MWLDLGIFPNSLVGGSLCNISFFLSQVFLLTLSAFLLSFTYRSAQSLHSKLYNFIRINEGILQFPKKRFSVSFYFVLLFFLINNFGSDLKKGKYLELGVIESQEAIIKYIKKSTWSRRYLWYKKSLLLLIYRGTFLSYNKFGKMDFSNFAAEVKEVQSVIHRWSPVFFWYPVHISSEKL